MARKHKVGLGAAFYVPKKKKRFVEATSATARFLGIVCEENPTLTIQEIYDLITDKTQYVYSPETVAVLDAHIKKRIRKMHPKLDVQRSRSGPKEGKK